MASLLPVHLKGGVLVGRAPPSPPLLSFACRPARLEIVGFSGALLVSPRDASSLAARGRINMTQRNMMILSGEQATPKGATVDQTLCTPRNTLALSNLL